MSTRTERYTRLVRYLPEGLKIAAMSADAQRVEELRLRCGRRLSAVYPDGERTLGGREVVSADIEHLVMAASKGSVYAAGESIRRGFITVEGGHRIGLCGWAVMKDGQVSNLTKLTGAAVRIAGQVVGAADGVISLFDDKWDSTLIIGPPGSGKTTLLRDLIRQLSDKKGCRISLVDERGEVAACCGVEPGLDVGAMTDVLCGCPKAEGILMMLRSMNPQIVAVDEITAPEDVEAINLAAGCGAALIATAHGASAEELRKRPIYRSLLDSGIFTNFVTIERDRTVKIERVD